MTTTRNQPEKLDYIDSLRGIAIILVIILHVGGVLLNLSKGMAVFSDYGQFGVQLFFLVSAFTLCHTMNRRNEAHLWKKFFLRRYFRVAPLYYFGIFLYFCFFSLRPILYGEAPAFASWYTFRNVMVNLLLINDFHPGWPNNLIVPGGWSIATEATFYMIFPILLLVYKRVEQYEFALIALPVLGLILCILSIITLDQTFSIIGTKGSWGELKNNSFIYFSILCQLPVFLTGMSLYFVLQKHDSIGKMGLYGSAFCFAGFSFFALCLMVYHEKYIYLFPFLAGVAFVFLFLLYRQIPALSSKLLSRIGQLSYSIYLFHFIFAWEGTRYLHIYLQNYLSSDMILIIGSGLTLAVTAVMAMFSEKYIERPGIELGKKIINRYKRKEEEPEISSDNVQAI